MEIKNNYGKVIFTTKEKTLQGANLWGKNLQDANLQDVNLRYADLWGANLRNADLRYADLRDANLRNADLQDTNLQGANLQGANLRGAKLQGANLQDAENIELIIAQTWILPEGDLIGWKKCRNEVIVKLLIPKDAKRSHAFGRKCRAEYADVLEVIGAEVGISYYDESIKYIVGSRVTPNSFDENWMNECSSGIHFFITRIEAENY